MKKYIPVLIITLLVVFTACKKSNTDSTPPIGPPTDPNAPTITGLSTSSGLPNSLLTITGTNFVAANAIVLDTVKINGLVAVIDTLTATKIVITVPAKATSGKITLSIGSSTTAAVKLTYATDFTILPFGAPPTVTGISSAKALPGTAVTITGTNFNSILANNIVTFNGVQATVVSVTNTQLVAIVPASATTGKVTVSIGNSSSTYPTDFQVTAIIYQVYTAGFPGINAVDAAGNLYGIGKVNGIGNLYSTSNNIIYKTPAPSSTTTLTSTVVAALGTNNVTNITAIAVDASGNIYAASGTEFVIYKIDAAGVVSTFAGNGISGYADGQGAAAQFIGPNGIVADAAGNVYVTDAYRIRKITPAGLVSTLAGSGLSGNTDGQGTAAAFGKLTGNVTIDAQGNIYADDGNSKTIIREISPAGVVTSYPIDGTAFGIVDADGNSFNGIVNMDCTQKPCSYSAYLLIINRSGFGTEYPLPLVNGYLSGGGSLFVEFYDHAMGTLYLATAALGLPAIVKMNFR